MGSVTIRNIDDEIKQAARLAAARNGRSLEAELRALLKSTYAQTNDERTARIQAMNGSQFIAHLVRTANGATFELSERRIDQDGEVFGAD